MYSYKRRGKHNGYLLLAILQSILLLSALVLTPAVSIAQDPDPSASQAPLAEQGDKIAPAADPEPNLKLRLYPRQIRLVAGGDAKQTSAWICPADIGASFGPDKEPGTGDDDCVSTRAKWSVDPKGGASVSRALGHKTRISLLSNAEAEVTAKAEGLTGTGLVSPKNVPASKPKAADLTKVTEPKAAEQPQADEPKVDLSVEPQADEPKAAEQPQADEPKADPSPEPQADEPKADPSPEPQADEPKVDPSVEPQADEPKVDPSVEPQADEPKVDPSVEPQADEPKADESPEPQADEPKVDPSVEPQADEPKADESPEPQADPSVEPQADPSVEPQNKPANRAANAGTPILLAANPNVAIDARLRDHVGVNDGTTGNCIRYSPADGNQTEWVGSPNTAWTAHGSPLNGSCPSDLNTSTQSAIGFRPTAATSVPTGTPFLLGRMTHNNNPINVRDQYFTGKLDVRLAGETLEFPWTLNETPNNSSPQTNPNNDDFTNFTSQIDDTEITIDGLTYKLVVLGFTQDTGSSCPATPSGAYVNEFRTTEGTQTYGCLYAELAQVRKLTIEKVAIVGEAPFPSFGFSSTSNLAGSPWANWSDSLLPTAAGPAGADSSAQQDFLPSEEDVVVTESAVNGWTLDSIVCKDGSGQDVSGINVNLGDRKVMLNNVPDADTNAAAPITCTFNNKPRTGTLKLVKTVMNDDGGTATTADFQGRINGDNVDWDLVVTLPVGDYTASEVALAGGAGYTAGPWSGDCAANGTVTVGNGQNKICTITNDDDPATLIVKKVVVNDDGGTLAAADFTFVVNGGAPISFEADGQNDISVDAGTYTVTEPAVDGYASTFDNCSQVVIANGGTAICTITNDDMPGTITLNKTVSGGDASISDFVPSINGTQVTWGVAVDLPAGSYTASESMNVSDYVAGAWGGACDAQGNVDLALGENLICTITNYYAELTIKKSADPAFYAKEGDIIGYTVTATNSGMATLTNVDVSDALIDSLDSWTCAPEIPATLAPGDSITCTAEYEITAADVDEGSVPNTACASSDETSQDVCDNETVYLSELAIVKSADVDYFTAAGDQVVYTVKATNTGEFTLTNVDISDELIDGLDDWECTPTLVVAELAAGESITCTATYEITDADVEEGSVLNTACAVSEQTPDVCDDVDIPLAQIEIVKSADVDSYSAVGDEILYTVTATNTGVATLTNVDISDDLIDGLDSWECKVGNSVTDLPVTSLLAGQSIICTATYQVTQADIEAGTVFNQACVDSDETPETCDDVTTPLAELEIVKSANVQSYSAVGDEIVYTVIATNIGEAELTNVDISDALIDGLESWACTPEIPATLAVGEQITCTATYTVVAADITAGTVFNQACVDSDETPETCDDVNVDLISIVIDKSASRNFVPVTGTDVTFTLAFSHPAGEPPVYMYSLVDDVYGDLLDPANPAVSENDCPAYVGLLVAPGEWYTCQFTAPVTVSLKKDHVNVATIIVTDGDANNLEPRFASANDDAVVKLREPEGSGEAVTPKPTKPPTDMLLVTDTLGGDAGGGFGDPISWALWVLLSALLILSTGFVIRRERVAEVRNRR